jgi:hypothetical protein
MNVSVPGNMITLCESNMSHAMEQAVRRQPSTSEIRFLAWISQCAIFG